MSERKPCRGCGKGTSCRIGGDPYHPDCFRENRVAKAHADAVTDADN